MLTSKMGCVKIIPEPGAQVKVDFRVLKIAFKLFRSGIEFKRVENKEFSSFH